MAKATAQIRREIDECLRRGRSDPRHPRHEDQENAPLRDRIQQLIDAWEPIIGIHVRQWSLKELED